MQIYTEEFMRLKIAVGILEERADELSDREVRQLAAALNAIEAVDTRLSESNAKQAQYMKERRRAQRLQGRM